VSGHRIILGCGYVGTAVARKWMDEGAEVYGVSRNESTLSQLKSSRFHPVVAEVDSHDWHGMVPDSPEVVLNCVSSAGGGVAGYRKSYIGGNESLTRWAEQGDPGQVIYTGSTAVYPFTDGREVWEEDAGGPELSETGSVVMESEKILFEHEKTGPVTTVLRLAGIYGPGRHYLLDQIRQEPAVLAGSGEYYLNLIYQADIVSAVNVVIGSSVAKGRAYNLSDGNAVRKSELASWLAKELGLRAPRFDPDAKSRRKMRVNRAGASPNRRIQIDRIRQELGWEPKFPTFRDGFAQIGL